MFLPQEIKISILSHLDIDTITQLVAITFWSEAAKTYLLDQKLLHPDLKTLYTHIRNQGISDRKEIIKNMHSFVHIVLGKPPSVIAKSLNEKYHATPSECARIGLTQRKVSKQYYRYVCQTWNLRKLIAKCWPLVNLGKFPFTSHELENNHIFIETNLPRIITTWVSCKTHKKIKSVDRYSPTLEYCLESGKSWTSEKGFFAEWQPKTVWDKVNE